MKARIQVSVVEYRAPKPGAHLVVLGGIHGDEPCGTESILRLIKELSEGRIRLARGRVTLIPCCNPRARLANQRFVDKNLNRVFLQSQRLRAYEGRLANVLISIIGKPTFLLDLHSFHVGGPKVQTFAMRADSQRVTDRIVKRLPIDYCLHAWQEVQAASGRPESVSTIDHAKRIGVPALGIECGQHRSRAARRIAYVCLRETMAGLGICDFNSHRKARLPQKLYFKYLRVYEAGGEFIRMWRNFEQVQKGDLIARGTNGATICAPITGKLTLPNSAARPGGEWFYITQPQLRRRIIRSGNDSRYVKKMRRTA